MNLDVGEGFCTMSRPDDLQSTIPLSRSTRSSPREFFFFDSTTGMNLGHLQTGENGPFGLLAQPHAYTGISVTGLFPNFATTVFGYSHTGEQTTVTRAGRNPIWSVDPAGGTVGIDLDTAPGDSTVTYFRFDKDNLLERRVSLQGPVARIAFPIVSLHEGDTLVVFNRELPPCSATWLDREGNQLTAPFALPSCQIGSGFPLLDGGLVLGELDRNAENHLRYQIADRATAVTAAPDWLLDRSPRQFFLLPGGKGYAFRAQSTDRTIELRAPAGNLCGRWDRPELGTGPLEIGRDGTLVVQDFRGAGCSFSWWPQLFR
jgi:hypothetical protein